MFKIDAAYGAWGMYNFYRMQLWKEKSKDLFILFTNWGRIGEYGGQFQNTPFGNSEQAIEEFEKNTCIRYEKLLIQGTSHGN